MNFKFKMFKNGFMQDKLAQSLSELGTAQPLLVIYLEIKSESFENFGPRIS